MTRRFAALALSTALVLTALALPAPALAQSPNSMAATGDSITRAFNLCFLPFTDCPAQSWSTGTNTTVNSHARRLGITSSAYNDAVSGAKMADLPSQVNTVFTRNVDYVTVLMGGNDVCTDTEAQMTSTSDYETAFSQAMDKLKTDSTPPLVYVVSVPNVKMLWEILKDNSTARSRWSSYNICQSLLANPLSTDQADVDRRERVKQRNMELNQALRAACAAYTFCRFDGERIFGNPFVPNDVSTRDYFHPSTAGQKKLADVSWTYGPLMTSAVNAPPAASFTVTDCSGLTCTFTDTSTDPNGISGRSWNFDADRPGGATSDIQQVQHTFAAGGTYSVKLYAIDGHGATSSTTQSVTVSTGGGGEPEPTTGTISGSVTDATTGNPIGGGSVTVSGTTFSAETGTDGTYTIADVPAGEGYTVTASAAGYETASITATVLAGQTTIVNFALQPNPTAEPGTMWIDSLTGIGIRVNRTFWRAEVTVSVVTDGATGVAGATVSGSFSTGGTASCTTDSAGTCSVTTGNLRNTVADTTYTVSDVTHGSLVYDPNVSVTTTGPIARPA